MNNNITKVLKSLSRHDQFCTKIIEKNKSDYKFSISGVDTFSSKLTKKAVASIIANATLAGFGRRQKTLRDKKVRDTWEIPKLKIKFLSDQWQLMLERNLNQIKNDLGLPTSGRLTAKLHNMLVYQNGQHFKSHQDSEKMAGMVGTMVILLPTDFSGGDFIIDQHGDKKIFKTSDKNNITILAFYADCHHEVKKVTRGVRVAFTYNLIFRPKEETITVTQCTALTKALGQYFDPISVSSEKEQSATEKDCPDSFVYLLDHQYTPAALNWNNLKGADRVRASALLGAAAELKLEAYLALADLHETWDVIDDTHYGYEDWDDDDYSEEGSDSSEDYELQDLIDSDSTLTNWIDLNGKKIKKDDLELNLFNVMVDTLFY